MTMLWTRKASAAQASPGFFSFLAGAVLAVVLIVEPSAARQSATVHDIVIVGNNALAASTIEEWMETKRGGAFSRADLARIDSGLAETGFPFGRVDSVVLRQSTDERSFDLLLYLREGKPARFAEVRLEGVKASDAPTLSAEPRLREGEPFAPRLLEQGITALLQQYEAIGYPFARIEIRDIRFEEGPAHVRVYVVLKIHEGTVARISELRVDGNSSTRTSVITRAARVSAGDLYRGDLPSKIKQRLEKLQLFSSVSMPELLVNDDQSVSLAVKVAEGNPNRFDGIAGYVPSSVAGAKGYVTGFVDVQFRNILGTGRRVSVRWNRETQTSQEIGIRYREPWIATLPVSAEGGYDQRKQDSTYVRENYDLALETALAENLMVGLALSGNKITPTEGYGRTVVGQSSALSIGFSLMYDARNDQVMPTGGSRFQTEYHTGRKEIRTPVRGSEDSRSSTQKLTFDVDYYASPFRNQVFAVLVSARDFRNDAIEFSDLFRLGGANSLRGYREGQFLGSRIAWANLEYRLLAGQRSFVFAFFDLGYAFVPQRPEAGLAGDEIRRSGFGAGVRLDTPLGLIGVSLAFGQGDTFSTAKLHLRLVNEF
jgi:outer membrane protein insertion porin family